MQKDHWKKDKNNHIKEHIDLSWETLVGEKTQQNFLYIEFDQVQSKTPTIIIVYPLPQYTLSLSLAQYLSVGCVRMREVPHLFIFIRWVPWITN